MSDEPDRDAILARRALLLSTAAAAVGCTLPDQGIQQRGERRLPLPSWDLILARRPPLSVSARVIDRDRVALEALGAKLEPLYEALRAAYTSVESAWSIPSNEGALRAAVAAIGRLDEKIEDARPHCGDPTSLPTSVVLRRRAHFAYLDATQKGLKDAVATLPSAPVSLFVGVCLSCAVDDRFVIRDILTFAHGASESTAALPPLGPANELLVTEGLAIVVHGHADAAEPSTLELSTARAEHVRQRLVKEASFPHDRIFAHGLADALPLEPPGGPKNRRVDFDVKY